VLQESRDSTTPSLGAGINETGASLICQRSSKLTLLTLKRPNPSDFRTVVLTKHAQHVVLIHFPIALFIAAVVFDLIAYWSKRRSLADAACYNLLGAALATIPVIATGIMV